MRFRTLLLSVLLLSALVFPGCDRPESGTDVKQPTLYDYRRPGGPREQVDERIPPTPPIAETFESQPQLSLFPRVGDYQPERDDERYPFWRTFNDHFTKVSGLVQDPETKNRAWGFRGIKTIDSVGYFSPVKVDPDTSYRVSYRVKADLPEGGRTGIGVIEFDRFLWIGEQYSERITREHVLGSRIGLELTGDVDWETKEFVLTTGPRTEMIHLVFYREGEHSRMPVLIDDIEIRKTESSNP